MQVFVVSAYTRIGRITSVYRHERDALKEAMEIIIKHYDKEYSREAFKENCCYYEAENGNDFVDVSRVQLE